MKTPRKKSPARGSSDESRADSPAEQPTANYSRVDDSPVERADNAPAEEQIRRRAYELYLERGDAPGDEMEDWLRAERELRDRSKSGRPRAEPGRESPGL